MANMEFIITEKAKIKARRRRTWNEKKWIPFRVCAWLFASVSLVSWVAFIPFFLDYSVSNADKEFTLMWVASTFFMLAVFAFSLIYNLTSHWIGDRPVEKLWIDDNMLFHSYRGAYGSSDIERKENLNKEYLHIFSINSIRNVTYDDKSKRIEFMVDGKVVIYSDARRKIMDGEFILNDYKAVFYDYYEPCLIDILKDLGFQIQKKTIDDFLIINNTD